jgi:hypothetical protein
MDTEKLTHLALILAASWTSGINLYLTTGSLGLAHRMGWIALPGDLEMLGDPLIIGTALVIYAIEFIADKVPYVDSAWDSVHTLIRPVGGAAIAYLATSEAGPVVQAATSLIGGTIALDSHLTKAGTRVAINASPEPVTNSIASVSEDAVVLGAMWLLINHPIVIAVLVVLFLGFSIWLIPKLFRLIKRMFLFLVGKGKPTKAPAPDLPASTP